MNTREKHLWINALSLGDNVSSYLLSDPDFEWHVDYFKSLTGISTQIKERLIDALTSQPVDILLEYLCKSKIEFITIDESGYPSTLKMVEDAPHLLYYKGNLSATESAAMGIVGARKCTEYGKWATSTIVQDLCQIGVHIVSGLAIGIDRVAHQTALKCHTPTIGVLGCGVDQIYPPSNRNIYHQMMDQDGLIVSEFPPGSKPLAFHFPRRNRIISGLSLGLVVIEAKEKSGTLITAGYAASQGRTIFAVPGNINSIYSVGCNQLIADGATPVLSAQSIIDEYEMLRILQKNVIQTQFDLASLTKEELEVMEALKSSAASIDELTLVCPMNVQEISSVITLLEIKGLITQVNQIFYPNY